MLAGDLVAVSNAIAKTPARLEKIARLGDLLKRLPPHDVAIAIPFLTGSLRQGRIGIGYAAVRDAAGVPPAGESTLHLSDIDDVFDRMARVRGGGSAAERVRLLRELFAKATAGEQEFLVRLLFGELRQGAVEGVLADAVARAAGVAPDLVRRAAMLAGSLAPVAVAALQDGPAALGRFAITPFAPVQPMLAGSAEGVEQALAGFDAASLEFKLDGARIQVHKVGDDVRAYSRSLRDVTAAIPDVVSLIRAVPARELILDGEVLARRPDGSPHPFQVTMRRFGRKEDAAPLRETLPLSPFFFDCLYADGSPLIDEPLARRVAALDDVVPPDLRMPRLVPASPADADAFVRAAETAGHEGVMVKGLHTPYAAGRRGAAWLKVKRPRTLDLVVLAAEWGSGRRRGTLSNLHLGARDTERGGFVMLGKTFKGLTDEMLAWQTRELLAREIGRDGHVVFVRPELVVEIAFNELQESPQYPGRIALRFARVKGYRTDKPASEADTFVTIQKLYEGATGLPAPVR